MRKVALMLAVGIMAVSSAVLAHDPPDELEVAVQFPAGSEPTIDGDCSEWDAVIPPSQYYLLGEKFYDGDKARGGMDASDLTLTTRVGWSANTQMLYYCQSVFDDVHVIDRGDSYDWYDDDGAEPMFVALHLSDQEIRDYRDAEGVNPQWGFNYAVPKAASGDTWMVISPCLACEWSLNDNDQHTFRWAFTGEDFGESTYNYEHAMKFLDNYPIGLDSYDDYSSFTWKTMSDGDIIHGTFRNNDDDGAGTDIDRWHTGSLGLGAFGLGDWYLEEINDDLPWNAATSVESQSWGRIKAQY